MHEKTEKQPQLVCSAKELEFISPGTEESYHEELPPGDPTVVYLWIITLMHCPEINDLPVQPWGEPWGMRILAERILLPLIIEPFIEAFWILKSAFNGLIINSPKWDRRINEWMHLRFRIDSLQIVHQIDGCVNVLLGFCWVCSHDE